MMPRLRRAWEAKELFPKDLLQHKLNEYLYLSYFKLALIAVFAVTFNSV